MADTVSLTPMTAEMYHRFFQEYENPPDLLLPGQEYVPYRYDRERVEAYIRRQAMKRRRCFAILCDGEVVGELKLYDIQEGTSAVLSISMKNAGCVNRGYGTQAERLAVEYVFHELDIPVLYADTVISNTRSQHVLEKVGFRLERQDEKFKYYRIQREEARVPQP